MKTKLIRFQLFLIISLLTTSCSTVKTTLNIKNYIETDMTVNVESFNKKGSLKVNESFIVNKASGKNPTDHVFKTNGYKGGNIKIKYNPNEAKTKFTLEPIAIPDSKDDMNRAISLTGLVLYDVNDNKQRLLDLGTDLKFNANTEFSRLIDIKSQLASLVIGIQDGNKLKIKDVISLDEVDLVYAAPSELKESSVTEKSVMSELKVTVPIYGSLEAKMSNKTLNQVNWDIKYYSYDNNISISSIITKLDSNEKSILLKALKLNNGDHKIWLVRSFDVIESGVFSVTNGTEVKTEGNAAIASVFTANAAYAFKAENSKFVTIPNKAYNVEYEEWQTVSELIAKLELDKAMPEITKNIKIMSPIIDFK